MLLTDENYSDDTKVIIRPYDKEVRVILFRSTPSQLHLGDKMLDECKGKEKDLSDQLKIQYKDSIQKTFPSSVRTNEISRAVCNDVNKKYPTRICFNSDEKAECMDMHEKAETTMTSPFHGLSSMLGSSVWWRLLVLLLCITPTVLSYRMCPVCPPPAGVQRRTTSWLGVHQVISLLPVLLLLSLLLPLLLPFLHLEHTATTTSTNTSPTILTLQYPILQSNTTITTITYHYYTPILFFL